MKLTRARLLFFFFPLILLLNVVAFWLGTRTVSHFSAKSRPTGSPPPENPNRAALRAVARRGFVFEHDMEKGNLKEVESKTRSQNFETNLKNVLVHHPVKRQKFYVRLQRSIVIPGGTPKQVETYRQLMIAGELATSITQQQAIEKEKKQVLNGAKVAPTVQTSSSSHVNTQKIK